MEVVKFILDTMFIGSQQQQQQQTNLEEEVENLDNNLVLESSCCGEGLTSLDTNLDADFINFTPVVNSEGDNNNNISNNI